MKVFFILLATDENFKNFGRANVPAAIAVFKGQEGDFSNFIFFNHKKNYVTVPKSLHVSFTIKFSIIFQLFSS